MIKNAKILEINDLKQKLDDRRERGERIIFTNGCFDLLHLGHVTYLQRARALGDCLVLGLNSDQSVRSIKGANRPIVNQVGRAGVMAALECVDYVILFDEDTPYETIKTLQPDVLVKGADWKGKGIIGQDIVEARGGCVEYVEYVDDCSTTNIIEEVLKKYGTS